MTETDAWYPPADEYWVDDADEYPHRYGDVFATPPLDELRSKKKPWTAVTVLHPSCELGAKAQGDTQVVVARVVPVSEHGQDNRAPIRTGWVERDGEIAIALAHTFWMPPRPGDDPDDDSYVDFRRTQRVPLQALRDAGRLAAMSHDARVALIRRDLYFRYRWLVSSEDVRGLEAARISGDPAFLGPPPIVARDRGTAYIGASHACLLTELGLDHAPQRESLDAEYLGATQLGS